jgi:peptidoglycan/LPS O-acetylase OafA/YrhL
MTDHTDTSPTVSAATRPYRPEIDGLRAISVAAVVLFHAHVPYLAGGFVGVDVFFVISGFLITQIILDETGAGTFSFARFYERRARRILPALFAMLAVCCAAALILLPDDLKLFSQSVAAVVAFCSNLLFWWQQRGYFAPAAESLPLLHTWSLGIEEQFYLLFPAAIVLMRRLDRRVVVPFIAAVCVVSFVYSVWASHRDPAAGFYSPLSRAWELMLGALLAARIVAPPTGRWMRETLCAIGLAAIAVAIHLPTFIARIPDAAVTISCLGAALLLYATEAHDGFFTRALSVKPLTLLGQASYSLYLWHWPLIVFGTYYILDLDTLHVARPICALIAIPIAFLSWRFIEQPFRGRTGIWPRRTIFLRAATAAAAFVVLGVLGYRLHGLPQRFGAPVREVLAAGARLPEGCGTHVHRVRIHGGLVCRIGELSKPPGFVLWGDSHAAMYSAMLDGLALRHKLGGIVAPWGKCPPLLETVARDCRRRNAAVLQFIEETHPSAVLLAARWGFHAEGQVDPRNNAPDDAAAAARRAALEAKFADALAAVVGRLAAAHIAVYFVTDVGEASFDVTDTLAKARITGTAVDASLSRSQYMQDMAGVTRAVVALENRGLLKTIDPQNILCDAQRCHFEKAGLPLYWNASHLGRLGAQTAAPAFEPLMTALSAKGPAGSPHS